MSIKKAIITAASPSQMDLPLQTVVNRTGDVGSAIGILLDEITAAGIEEIAIVVCPGQVSRFQENLASHRERLTFFEQEQPRGYGDAVLRAAEFTKTESFLHLVSDHLYVTRSSQSCAAQLLDLAAREQCAVSAIQPTRENRLFSFGVVGGRPVPQQAGLFEIDAVLEKPTPTEAERKLVVPGQRAGHYLCLFGMHVLTPEIFELLDYNKANLEGTASLTLSPALDQLAQSQRYLAAQLDGERYDIGSKYGLLMAQLAIALAGDDRDNILTELVELVAKS